MIQPRYTAIRLAFQILLVLALSIPVSAQNNTATLRIFAFSQTDGSPLLGANVFLIESEGDTLRRGVTDAYGLTEFARIASGTYRLHVTHIGYDPYNETVTLEENEIRIYRSFLPEATVVMDEVIVQVTRGVTRREAGRQRITAVDLGRIPTPGTGGDLSVYLQTLPGVVTSGDRGGELFIRGGTPIQNRVLVENIPVVKPFHMSNLFSAFPQEVINNVELYAGGFGAEYSGATSSVLDVGLRQGNMRRFESKAAVSPYLVSLLAEGPVSRDQQSFLFMGRHSAIEQTGHGLTGEEIPLLFYDMTARYSINWPGLICNLTGLHTCDRGKINPERDVNLTWTNTAAGMRCLGFSEELNQTVEFTIGYSGYNSSESGIDDVSRTSGIHMGFLQVDNNNELFGLATDYGFHLAFSRFTADLEAPFANITREGIRFTDLDTSLEIVTTVISSYLTMRWQPSRFFTLRSGLTSQMNFSDLAPTFEPRIRILWQPDGSDRREFSLAVGRYFQMMEGITDVRDAGTVFYVYKPTDRHDPYPQSLHGILGYREQFSRSFGLSVESYIKRHWHIPVAQWTREPGNTIRTALADGLTYGADIQIELDLYPLYLSVGYGLAEVTYEASASDLVAWLDEPVFRFNPSHDRRHQINVVSGYDIAGFTVGLSWMYSSGNPFTRIAAFDLALNNLPNQHPLRHQGQALTLYSVPFDGRLPNFHRLDVSLSRSIELTGRVSVDLEAGAINTYDVRNVFYFDSNTLQQVDQMPLLPYASISMHFR